MDFILNNLANKKVNIIKHASQKIKMNNREQSYLGGN